MSKYCFRLHISSRDARIESRAVIHGKALTFVLALFMLPAYPLTAGDPPIEIAKRIQLPLRFIENTGQWDDAVQFGVFRGMEKAAFTRKGVTFFRPRRRPQRMPAINDVGQSVLPDDDAWKQLDRLELRFVRPSPSMRVMGSELTATRTNIYHGSDSSRWRSELASYEGVRYENVWDGVDVEYSERNGMLVRRIVIDSGANIQSIAFTGSGSAEAGVFENSLWMNGDGDAFVSGGNIETRGDTTRILPYRNFLDRRLVIETELNTYFGGDGEEWLLGQDIDADGRLILGLVVTSTDLPVTLLPRPIMTSGTWESDYYIAAFSVDLDTLLWSTYLGGSSEDWPPRTMVIFGTTSKALAVDKRGYSHIIGATESKDYPITAGAFQENRPPEGPGYMGHQTVSVLSRLNRDGYLEESSWLGGPAWYGVTGIYAKEKDRISISGVAEGEQSFITPNTVIDTLLILPDSLPGYPPRYGALLSLDSNYDSHVATYLPAATQSGYREGPLLVMDHENHLIITLRDVNLATRPPSIRPWQEPKVDSIRDVMLIKYAPDLSKYIFTTWMGGKAGIYDLEIDAGNNILIAGSSRFSSGHIPLHRPLSSNWGNHINTLEGYQHRFIAKFPPLGGDPVFITVLPFLESGGTNEQLTISETECGEILLLGGLVRPLSFPFRQPLDTVSSVYNTFIMLLRGDGQAIQHAGYWHIDEKYIYRDKPVFGLHPSGTGVGDSQEDDILTVHADQLMIVGKVPRENADSLTTFRALQPLYGGGEGDLVLIRTRVPGCTVLECSVSMPDTVRISREPAWIAPERMSVEMEVANIDPVRGAGDVECVLTLPPGIVLDPANQPLRQSPPGPLRPSETAIFTWAVRVDTSALALSPDSGVWIDAVTYYRDADAPIPGAPSVSPCDHYLRFLSLDKVDPLFGCDVAAPDSLAVQMSAEGYIPEPFDIRFTTENITTEPVQFARFALHFGGDMGGIPVPSGDRFKPGLTLAPAQTHGLTWQARAERRAKDRVMQVFITGEDSIGNVLTICETEVFVPELLSPQCTALGPSDLRVNPATGAHSPDPILARLALQQVLDTILVDAACEIDLSGAHFLTLAGSENPRQETGLLRAGAKDTLDWQLVLSAVPMSAVKDTLLYRVYSGGELRSVCEQVVCILPLKEDVGCTLTARDSLSGSEVLSRTAVPLTSVIRNTGTVPLGVGRIALDIPADRGLYAFESLSLTGFTLPPGSDTTLQWTLHADILRAGRSVRLEVTAFDMSDQLLTSCVHTLFIAGAEDLRCELSAPDTVRFDRGVPGYDPDPLPVVMDLENLLDETEQGLELVLDLSTTHRLELAAGETATRTQALLDSHATASFTWLLHPLAGAQAERQTITVRYRSAADSNWRSCSHDLFIETWPEELSSVCVTGGHDSLYSDAAYESFIPDPLHVSYAVTNTGTVPLTGCAARIVLPQGFVLSGGADEQSYTAPLQLAGAPVPEGTILPGYTDTRWWFVEPTRDLTTVGVAPVEWQWRSAEEGSTTGCPDTIFFVADPPGGIVLTPLAMEFEAEKDGPLPAAQTVHLWTGGGLNMPWTAHGYPSASSWWVEAQPNAGTQAARLDVQPSTTALNVGVHHGALRLAGSAINLPQDIAVSYTIHSTTGAQDPAAPQRLTMEAWPQPVRAGGVLRLRMVASGSDDVQLTMHDLLGRERARFRVQSAEVFSLDLSPLNLAPGIYQVRALMDDGRQLNRTISILR